MDRDSSNRLRALLALARVSGLPTVWSNCLAGWWLGGGGNFSKLPWLVSGVSVIYFGAAFLNDAFDAEFDRQNNLKRPIALGTISRREVLRWAAAWLALGELLLCASGLVPGALGLLLIGCVVVYSVMHRRVTISPWLLGLCRFFTYPIAAAIGVFGVTGFAIWFGLTLGIYTTGFGFFARQKTAREEIAPWPVALLVFPVIFGLVAYADGYRQSVIIAGVFLMIWLAVCLRPVFQPGANRRQAITELFAGIILVDWLAVTPECPREMTMIFWLLFGVTLLAQRLTG